MSRKWQKGKSRLVSEWPLPSRGGHSHSADRRWKAVCAEGEQVKAREFNARDLEAATPSIHHLIDGADFRKKKRSTGTFTRRVVRNNCNLTLKQ
jgi:hypothetical protein